MAGDISKIQNLCETLGFGDASELAIHMQVPVRGPNSIVEW